MKKKKVASRKKTTKKSGRASRVKVIQPEIVMESSKPSFERHVEIHQTVMGGEVVKTMTMTYQSRSEPDWAAE